MEKCYLCPRSCGIDRSKNKGYCNQSGLKVARVSLHKWEEPIISGSNGSGTIFFSGCNLKCVYCQNYDVSHGKGKDITPQILADIFKKIEDSGAHNINLVTPTHFVDDILKAADIYAPKLPVVYNCGGYDSIYTLDKLKDFVDIWLPDFKYSDNSLAKKYVSIMGQYTPFGDAFKFDEINRKLKPLEYKIAVEYAKKFKLFNSFIQSLDSASKEFIPNFDESPIDFDFL